VGGGLLQTHLRARGIQHPDGEEQHDHDRGDGDRELRRPRIVEPPAHETASARRTRSVEPLGKPPVDPPDDTASALVEWFHATKPNTSPADEHHWSGDTEDWLRAHTTGKSLSRTVAWAVQPGAAAVQPAGGGTRAYPVAHQYCLPMSSEGGAQLRKGVVEYCILGVLARQPMYGWQLAEILAGAGVIAGIGTLYPLLGRLRDRGFIVAFEMASDSGPPRKYYQPSDSGLAHLAAFRSQWPAFTSTVSQLIEESPSGTQ